MMIFKYSKYPNAAKELPALHDGERAGESVADSVDRLRDAGRSPSTRSIRSGRRSEDRRRIATSMKIMLPNGYAGEMGYASAARMADFIMVEHGRRSRVGIEIAEGGGGAGAEARRALLQGLILRRADSASTH